LFFGSAGTLAVLGVGKWALGWNPAAGLVFAAGLLLLLATQIFSLLAVFVFVTLGGREGSSFLPLRDYVYFIAGGSRIHPSGRAIDATPER
jgi:hypothetical protein